VVLGGHWLRVIIYLGAHKCGGLELEEAADGGSAWRDRGGVAAELWYKGARARLLQDGEEEKMIFSSIPRQGIRASRWPVHVGVARYRGQQWEFRSGGDKLGERPIGFTAN
jgi:hypothetical protein